MAFARQNKTLSIKISTFLAVTLRIIKNGIVLMKLAITIKVIIFYFKYSKIHNNIL